MSRRLFNSTANLVVYHTLCGAKSCSQSFVHRAEDALSLCDEPNWYAYWSFRVHCADTHNCDVPHRGPKCEFARHSPHRLKLHGDLKAFVRVDSFHRFSPVRTWTPSHLNTGQEKVHENCICDT